MNRQNNDIELELHNLLKEAEEMIMKRDNYIKQLDKRVSELTDRDEKMRRMIQTLKHKYANKRPYTEKKQEVEQPNFESNKKRRKTQRIDTEDEEGETIVQSINKKLRYGY